ncbi:MAG: helix-turn-helix transcriptional regulator [Oscillospiraceae bacterium]|nr:helix-turn-helix transcriptional regulator [Oscillospiraceae bacterium]
MSESIPKRWHIDENTYDAYTVESLKTVDTHWHSHFLINLFTEGQGIQEINGKSYPIRRGSIIIISPLDFHRNIVSDEEKVSVCAVKFSDKFFYDSLADLCSLEDFPIVTTLSDEDYETAKTLFELLLSQQEKKTLIGADKFSRSLIEQLVILALRAVGKKKSEGNVTKMRRALGYIHYNFRNGLKVEDVAKHIGYSPNYFSSEFKRETGIEFQKYLQDLRLDFAMNLLRFSKITITEACFESGFKTLSHFSQTFKKKFGTAPGKIKKEK